MNIPPFNSYLGTEIVRRQDGSAEVALELAAHHLNRRGVAHGGVITSLLDSALGAAVISSIPEDWWCATISLSTQFLDGAREGRLVAAGQVVRRGRRVAFATGDVRDENGRLIATANGSWHLWAFRPGGRPRVVSGAVVALRDGGAPVPVGKILAVGRNYAEHVAEMGAAPGTEPVLFLKPSSALLHEGEPLRLPVGAGEVHHEVELVVVIGRRGRGIPRERALDHVLGYAVGLDMTLRDQQRRAKERGEPWSLSKGFDGSAPISAVTSREAVDDPSGRVIRLAVNGEIRQQGNTSQMLHDVPGLICLASRWITLERGDLLFTGTPAGVGAVVPGDRIEAEIDGLGSLVIEVESAADHSGPAGNSLSP